MCGIAGVASMAGRSTINLVGLEAMTDSLLHRGPDEAGHGICDGVALGMRRLSIIDLEGGSQPLYNEDHSIRVVFSSAARPPGALHVGALLWAICGDQGGYFPVKG